MLSIHWLVPQCQNCWSNETSPESRAPLRSSLHQPSLSGQFMSPFEKLLQNPERSQYSIWNAHNSIQWKPIFSRELKSLSFWWEQFPSCISSSSSHWFWLYRCLKRVTLSINVNAYKYYTYILLWYRYFLTSQFHQIEEQLNALHSGASRQTKIPTGFRKRQAEIFKNQKWNCRKK